MGDAGRALPGLKPRAVLAAVVLLGASALLIIAAGWASPAAGWLGDWLRWSPWAGVQNVDADRFLLVLGLFAIQFSSVHQTPPHRVSGWEQSPERCSGLSVRPGTAVVVTGGACALRMRRVMPQHQCAAQCRRVSARMGRLRWLISEPIPGSDFGVTAPCFVLDRVNSVSTGHHDAQI